MWLSGLSTFIWLVSGKPYFSLKIILILFLGGKEISSVHKSPAHWTESCIFKIVPSFIRLINSVCNNVGLFVIQAHRQHCFQVLWNLTYFAFSFHTLPLNIQIMCLAESTTSYTAFSKWYAEEVWVCLHWAYKTLTHKRTYSLLKLFIKVFKEEINK